MTFLSFYVTGGGGGGGGGSGVSTSILNTRGSYPSPGTTLFHLKI